jgi:hypothetical protein
MKPVCCNWSRSRCRAYSGKGLALSLRREFGAEAHLAVTVDEAGMFVIVARAGRSTKAAKRRTEPGSDNTAYDRADCPTWVNFSWEAEARRFLAHTAAQRVVAVTQPCDQARACAFAPAILLAELFHLRPQYYRPFDHRWQQ